MRRAGERVQEIPENEMFKSYWESFKSEQGVKVIRSGVIRDSGGSGRQKPTLLTIARDLTFSLYITGCI